MKNTITRELALEAISEQVEIRDGWNMLQKVFVGQEEITYFNGVDVMKLELNLCTIAQYFPESFEVET